MDRALTWLNILNNFKKVFYERDRIKSHQNYSSDFEY